MQEVASREFSEIAGKLSEDFAVRLNVKEAAVEEEETKSPAPEDEEFSFSNAFGDRSPVAAEDVFEDGWIRPVFPLFNRELFHSGEEDGLRPPLKKLFVEEEEAEGPYCEWDGKKAVVVREAATTTGCKKSNSTGFSKLRRLRELTMRSHSDGKDAFVFLSSGRETKPGDNVNKPEKTKTKKKVMKKKKSAKVATSFSAHYATSRAKKEDNKRVSYLPYRVGFFANVSGGTSRNVHPF